MQKRFVIYAVAPQAQLAQELVRLEQTHGVRFREPCPLDISNATQPSRPADGRDTAVPVWVWAGDAASFRAQARTVLLETVHPLVHSSESAWCLAFPFPASKLAAQPLTLEQRSLLDVEDVGRLLEAATAPRPRLTSPRCAHSNAEDDAHLEGLDPGQRRAATHGDGPARVLAAAGSGKTKTMVARIVTLVRRGVPPRSILALAFNTEAATQLAERLGAVGVPSTRRVLVPGVVAPPDDDGVHCATFNAFGLRFQRDVLGQVPHVASDPGIEERLIRAAAHSSRDRRHDPSDPFAAHTTDAAWSLRGHLDGLRADLCAPSLQTSQQVERYRRAQETAGIQSFDDQVFATVEALLAHPRQRHAVQDLYRHVLVDEFQDVNPAQLALLDIVSRPWRDLFVVGDDDQLIYGWRSAHPDSILRFGEDLPRPPLRGDYTLATNYRCSTAVVARSSRLIAHNTRRVAKTVHARPQAPQEAVVFLAADSLGQRAAQVATFLAAERTRLSVSWADLAVLCRYRSQLTRVAPLLRDHGVPCTLPERPSALATAAARDVADLLSDVIASGLPPQCTALEAVALAVASRGHATPRGAASTPRSSREHGQTLSASRSAPLDADREAALDAARILAAECASPEVFLQRWRRWSQAAETVPHEAAPDGVLLATVHATKGREYASVAVLDFSPALEQLTDSEVEEERRVLYVALTRACRRCLLTIDTARGAPHPFLRELADPPTRQEARAIAHESRRLHDQIEPLVGAAGPLLRLALHERQAATMRPSRGTSGQLACQLDTQSALGHRSSTAFAPCGPREQPFTAAMLPAETAMLLTRYLELRGRLTERRLFAPPSPAAALWARLTQVQAQ